MKKGTLALVVILALIALGLWYYTSNKAPAPSPTPSTSETSDNQTGTPVMQGTMETGEIPSVDVNADVTAGVVKTFTVTSSNFTFAPKTLTVKKGDHVKITLENSGGTHDLKIDEFNVATPRIGSGASASIEFIADKVGSFDYYCSVGNHRAMGMVGTLTVTE